MLVIVQAIGGNSDSGLSLALTNQVVDCSLQCVDLCFKGNSRALSMVPYVNDAF